MGWRRVCAVVLAVCSASVIAEGSEWHTLEQLIQHGRFEVPEAVLEVRFTYDADALPSLELTGAAIKKGYPPQYDPVEYGYTLSLHSASGDTLSLLIFQVPTRVFNPPPIGGEAADGAPVVLRQVEFALTLAMHPEAVELRVADPQGLPVLQSSLHHVPVQFNPLHFRTLQPSAMGIRRLRPLERLVRWLDALAVPDAAAEGVLDITFIGDNYGAVDLTLFDQDVDRVVSHLLTYEPYRSRAAEVTFHSVDNTADLGCVHSSSMSRLITCNNSTVTSVVNTAGAPYDKIIVLVKDSSYGGSGGSIAVSYNGSYAPQVVTHEFAHSLGGLLDEYNLYSTTGQTSGATYANCYAGTTLPNPAWDGTVSLSDYVAGCKYPNWYRSSACSIMKDLSCRYFNSVSQRALSARLDYYAGNAQPTLNFSGSPTLVAVGGTATLSWSASQVTGCAASGGWSGDKPLSGSEVVAPSVTGSFTITCQSSAGPLSKTVSVAVDASAPTVSLTAPSSGATVTGTLTLTGSAVDDQTVSRVDFYRDGSLIGSDNTEPYSTSWNTSSTLAGQHILGAQAVDAAGNLGLSPPVTVTVQNLSSSDTAAPSVVLIRPANGARVSGKIEIKAVATDNVGVVKSEIWIDGIRRAISKRGTIRMIWNTGYSSAGAHTIVVKAMDRAGNIGSVTITVYK